MRDWQKLLYLIYWKEAICGIRQYIMSLRKF